jgi:uncharacterized membrane protein
MNELDDPVSNSKNYKWGFFYCNPSDSRVFVPKRYGFGYGLNFSKPYVAIGLILILLIILYQAVTH